MEYRSGDLEYTRGQADFYNSLMCDDLLYKLAPACSQCAAPEVYLIRDEYNQRFICEYCGGVSCSMNIRNGHIIKR